MSTSPFKPTEIHAALNGRFTLGPELRVGGQGVVYRATRVCDAGGAACSDEVALKLHLDSRQDERVEREIRAMKNLRHPALARLLEEGIVTLSGLQTHYVAWEFIDGHPLDAKLSNGCLNEQEVLRIARDVTSAIEVLWSQHIVHRDITPKNIMVRSDGTAVLIDLGGARHLDNSTITALGATFGTLGYFSPEQFRAERAITCASDIFTLAVVLLECLLGHHPTNHDQLQLASAPPSVDVLVPGVSKEFRETLTKMLQLRAPFRPSITQLRTILERLVNVR